MRIATRQAFGDALELLWEKHEDIVVLDADLSWSTKTNQFAKKFPERFFNIGIAEQDLIGTAAGLAIAGKNAFAATFAVFAVWRAYDQIRNTIAYSKLNVKIIGSHAGILTGEDGATHQMLEDLSLMRGLENMIVLSPSDAEETTQIMKFLANYEGPAYLRLWRAWVEAIHNSDYKFELWKWDLVKEWKDICIISTGACSPQAVIAAAKLDENGISTQVVNMASISPFDKEWTKELWKKFNKIFTIEDHSINGGLGSCVAEVLAENWCKAKLTRLWMTTFGESGTPDDLYKKYGLDAEGIFNSIKK